MFTVAPGDWWGSGKHAAEKRELICLKRVICFRSGMLGRMGRRRLFQVDITAKGIKRRRLLRAVIGSGSVSWRSCLADEDMATWRRVACSSGKGS